MTLGDSSLTRSVSWKYSASRRSRSFSGKCSGQRELLVPQIIQHVPEEEAVPVDEEARPVGQLAPASAPPGTGRREHTGQSAIRDAEQRRVLGHIDLAPYVQLHHLGEGRGHAGPWAAAAEAPGELDEEHSSR